MDASAGAGVRRLTIASSAGGTRLTAASMTTLTDLLHAPGSTVVVIEGGPNDFCEGLDLDALRAAGDSGADLLARYASLLTAITNAPCPVIALVNGPALGGGAGIAAAADAVLASPGASFACPETLLGVIPAVAFPAIARRIGLPRARLLALGAPPIPAEVALRWGLVDEVADDLEAACARHVRRFSRADARAVRAMKGLIAQHFSGEDADYRREAIACFGGLVAGQTTEGRLARFAAGLAPWDEWGVS